jgi:hypothetical protein
MADELQKTWEERIKRALKVKEQWMSDFKVQLGRDYFEGKQNPGWPEAEWITVNKIYSHLQAQLPILYSMDPYFYVKLKKSYNPISQQELLQMQQTGQPPAKIAEMEAKGKGRQAMLNYLKVELDMKSKARLGIQDAHFAFGVGKSRRASDLKKHPHAGDPIKGDDGKELLDEQTGKPLTYPERIPVNERYELDRIDPDDMLFDEDAGPLQDSWKWLAQKIRMTKQEALDDPRYKKSAVKSIRGKKRKTDEDQKKGIVSSLVSKVLGEKPEDEFVDIWEIYDLKACEMLAVAEDADELVMKPRSLPPGIEKHPYSFLRFTLRDKSPYPIPPIYNALDPQKEICLARSRWMTHRKRFDRKYEAVVRKFEDADTEIAKLESGGDGTVIRVLELGAVAPIQDAPLDQQGILEIQALDNDIVEALGTPGNARGVANSDSATEASILDNRLEVREGDRMSMVVDWVLDMARKLDMLVQYHIEEDEAVKITGPQGTMWQMIRADDYKEIEGEYEYSVNVGASQPRLPEIERAQWIAFMSQVVIPFPHILQAPSMMKRMAEMFHIEDEAAVEELRQIGIKIMQGMLPMPGGQGGGPSENPVAQIMGMAQGAAGGNANGGGAPASLQ